MSDLKISELLAEEEKTIWIKYLDDFEINIRYLPRRELVKISETSTEITWDKKTHTRIDKVNTDRFYSKFVDKAILGWKGLTLSTLSKIVPINLNGQDPKAEVVFTKENAIELLRSGYDLDSFLQSSILDITQFDVEQNKALGEI
jgi:hypothetical protein